MNDELQEAMDDLEFLFKADRYPSLKPSWDLIKSYLPSHQTRWINNDEHNLKVKFL